MPREIWLGPVLNRNRERLLARCRDMLRSGRGREFVYLAATKPLMESVSASLLAGEVTGTIDQLNVYLLSGFSRRVLAKARYADTGDPLPYFAAIDTDLRPAQRPLFSRILTRLSEANAVPSFGQLARSDGVVASMAGLVAEIQRAGTSAEEFRAVVRRREALDAESKPGRETTEPVAAASEEERREAARIASIDYDRDTATVYEHYESILDANRLTDASRDYLRALAVLRGELFGRQVRVPFVDEAQLLVVDGFFDILPVHAEILSLLVRRFPESIVNLNYDRRNPNAFIAFKDVVERFGDRAGFEEIAEVEGLPVSAELEPLRTRLFHPDAEPPAADAIPGVAEAGDGVRLLHAPDRPREVRAVAKEIKRLVLDEGFEPQEIAVVYRDRDRYEPLVRDVFREENVAVSLGERRRLTDLAAARAAMKVLDAAISNRGREGRQVRVARVVAVLKTDYFSLAPPAPPQPEQGVLPFDEPPPVEDDALGPDDVENAVAFVGAELVLDDWLRRAHRLVNRLVGDGGVHRFLEADDPADVDPNADDRPRVKSPRVRADFPVDTLRKAIGLVEAIGEVVLSIPPEAPADEMARAFRAALDALNFEPRLLAAAREAALDEEDLRRAALDLRAVEGLRRAIDAVVEATRLAATIATPRRDAGDTRLTRAEFRAELARAMESHEILVAAETEGAVRSLGATDLRGMRFPVVFVLGLVDGEFPARARGDWIYPQHERENLRDVGLPLENLSPEESLRAEEHYFYQVACRATRRLTFCRPLAADDDADTLPSPFIAEVEKAVGRRLVARTTTAGFEGETLLEATTPAELARAVVRARGEGGHATNAAVLDALEVFARADRPGRRPILSRSALRRVAIERARESGEFDEFDGLLRNDLLRHLTGVAYGRHVFSASELNEFGHCGFRFYLKRVLGLTPRVEAALDLQALETGVLLHDALRRFLERYRGTSIAEVDREALRAALAEACDTVFDAFERGMPPLNPRLWRIERRVLGIMLERVLDDEIELQRRLAPAGVAPRYFELAFGLPKLDADPHSSPDPLVLLRVPDDPDSEAIRLRGQIDRVDASADGRLVAYDYKTSSGPRLKDMEEGRDVQLGVYLAALEHLFAGPDEQVAGGGYYALRTTASRRNNGLYRDDMHQVTDIRSSLTSSLAPDRFEGVRDVIRANLWDAFDRIRGGDFRVSPSLDEKTCTYCDYPRVCRYERHRIAGKRRRSGDRRGRPMRPLAGRAVPIKPEDSTG